MKLNAENVHKTFLKCLFTEEELKYDFKIAKEAKGVMLNVAFNIDRLNNEKNNIYDMLKCLSDDFMIDKGCGMSFLNMCVDKNENHWGEHRTVDELVCLGLGIDALSFLLPRDMWYLLPGEMPYIVVKDLK